MKKGLSAAFRAPFAGRSWTGLAYLLLTAPLDLAAAVLLLALTLVGAVLLITPLGAWLLALGLTVATALGSLRRSAVRALLGEQVPAPLLPVATGTGVFAKRRALLTASTGWRALAYHLVRLPLAPLSLAVGAAGYVYAVVFATLPLQRHTVHPWWATVGGWAVAVLLLLAAPWLLRSVLRLDLVLVRALLGPSRRGQRMRELRRSRDLAVTDAAATLRKVERDLHDGAQAKLVGVGMHVAMARELLTAGAPPERVRTALDSAQGALTESLEELRTLVRGIHPPVLDRGLDAALATVAAGAALPVTVRTDLPRRPSPAVESILYFCACELITNAGRHSGARRADVDLTDVDGLLRLRVRDDGRGGARQRPGGGLAGLADRVRVVDGQLSVRSPAGGPTVVTVEIPYEPSERSGG